jgi:hypothetical protein
MATRSFGATPECIKRLGIWRASWAARRKLTTSGGTSKTAADRTTHTLPIGRTHLGLGDTRAYLDCLELAFKEREPFLASMWVFQGSDRVRDDCRFVRLSRQLGFTH